MKAAVILAGCGAKDGSEIHESVFSLLALQEAGFETAAFAIDDTQHEVINHFNQQETKEKRNMLVEAARITRGKISPLSELKVNDFAALVLPGGFGSAKNLCDYAFKGSAMKVRPEIVKNIQDFYDQKKAIGAICIAPMLVGKVLGVKKITLTIGPDVEAAHVLTAWGVQVKPCAKGACIVDINHQIVSTPAYMYADSTMNEVFLGVRHLAKALHQLCASSTPQGN